MRNLVTRRDLLKYSPCTVYTTSACCSHMNPPKHIPSPRGNTQQTREVDPLYVWCRATVYDAGSTSDIQWSTCRLCWVSGRRLHLIKCNLLPFRPQVAVYNYFHDICNIIYVVHICCKLTYVLCLLASCLTLISRCFFSSTSGPKTVIQVWGPAVDENRKLELSSTQRAWHAPSNSFYYFGQPTCVGKLSLKSHL